MSASGSGRCRPPRQTPPWRHHPRQTRGPAGRHPRYMATAVDGTHPAGMHSCFFFLLICVILGCPKEPDFNILDPSLS